MTRFPIVRLFAAAGLAVAFLSLSGCAGAEGGDPEAAAPAVPAGAPRTIRIETLVVGPTSFEDVIELTGSVEATNDATLSAQAAGSIVYRAPRGAYVARGGTVAQIDSTLLHAGYLQATALRDVAKAQYEWSKDTYDRQAPLFQDSIISANEFERVRAQLNQGLGQLRQAEAAVAQLREQLDNTRIAAPFSGVVEDYLTEIGEQVAPGSPVARMVNTQAVKIVTGVPERYAIDIRSGSRVEVVLDQYGGERYSAELTFVGSAIDAGSRTFPVEIRLDNADRALKPAMSVRLFITRNQLKDVLVVPQHAVLLDESGYGAFIVESGTEGRVARRRSVELGASYAGYVVVTDGIEAGDEVVVLGQHNLTDGNAVEVVTRASASTTRLAATE
jgi:membrane fusion protein (multidrug efflux system)